MSNELIRVEIGDIYFYPRIGPVKMTDRRLESFGGRPAVQVTIWRSLTEKGSFVIPADNVSSVLRPIIDKAEVAEIFKALSDEGISRISKIHSKRFRQQTEKINEGTTLDLAEIVRDLHRRKIHKTPSKLSYSESTNLEAALRSLSQEIAIALGISDEQACRRIERAALKPFEIKPSRRKAVAA